MGFCSFVAITIHFLTRSLVYWSLVLVLHVAFVARCPLTEHVLRRLDDMIIVRFVDCSLSLSLLSSLSITVARKSTDEALAEMYEPAPIITEADRTNDMRSLNRALRERLYLVIRRTPNSSHYQFPQTLTPSLEVSMRAYAELALRSAIPAGGDDPLKAFFISNTPATHVAHLYRDDYQRSTGFYGVKVFFYRAQLMSGSLPEGPAALAGGADYAWAREDELPELLSAETYRAVQPILFGVGDKVDLQIEYEEPAVESL
jgi:large subunit ribosomal protein L46